MTDPKFLELIVAKSLKSVDPRNMTNTSQGTHLMRCDDHGVIDMRLQTPVRSDVGNADLQKIRFLRGQLVLEDDVMLVRE